MSISAAEVKKLRDATGVGMMDCKKALVEAEGDFDAAVALLRKKGQKVAAKRADREATEGVIVTKSSDDGTTAILVEVNCETDFVARNDDFQEYAESIAELILDEQPDDMEQLMALDHEADRSVEQSLIDLTGKIGEKIDIRRFEVMSSDDGRVISYIHPGARLGVLVDVLGDDVEDAGRDVAMQVAALNPVARTRDEVPDEVTEKEQEIARDAAINEGKPEHIIGRIVEGKLDRYFKDNVLLEQPFVKDSSQTVQEMLESEDASVTRFTRFALGE